MDAALKKFQEGREHVRSGRISRAADCFSAALLERPDWVQARYNYAWSLARLGHTLEAESEYRKAIQADPLFPSSYSELVRLLNNVGRFDDAISTGIEGVAHHPGHFPLLHNLGWAYYRAGKSEQAEQCFRATLRIKPRSAFTLEALAELLTLQERWKEAEQIYRSLSEQYPQLSIYYEQTAFCLVRQEKIRFAEHFFRAALAEGSKNVDTWAGLGLCLCIRGIEEEEKNLLDEGWKCISGALSRDIKNPLAREAFSILVSSAGSKLDIRIKVLAKMMGGKIYTQF